MKTRNEPFAYGLFAGLLVLLLGMIINASCVPASAMRRAQLEQEFDASVDITMMCLQPDTSLDVWKGTGVILDGNIVLTAGHVTQHDGICSLQTTSNQGITRNMVVTKLDTNNDLAVLMPANGEPVLPETHVHFGVAPQLGDTVCAITAYPTVMHKCGEVEPMWKSAKPYIHFNVVIEPGNSGSALYNEDGELVGIVDQTHYSQVNKQFLTGLAVPLQGIRL